MHHLDRILHARDAARHGFGQRRVNHDNILVQELAAKVRQAALKYEREEAANRFNIDLIFCDKTGHFRPQNCVLPFKRADKQGRKTFVIRLVFY
jgi:hypothetical protein